jgi:two-component system phosphate regulon sensor histidine kinase PhoR
VTPLWLEEALRSAAWMLAGGTIGWLLGSPGLGLWAGTLCFALLHMRRLKEFLAHLADESSDLPEGQGPWAEAYNQLYRLRVRFKKRRKKLRKALLRFRQSAAALPDGVVLLSADHEIQWFNPAARNLLGLQDAPDTGHRITNIVRHPDFVAWLHGHTGGEPKELPSPELPGATLEMQLAPFGRNEWLLVVRDITRLRALEIARRDFVANASHELRTPLTVISGYVESLGGLAAEPLLPAINSMRQQADRMQRIITDLLLLTRLESQPAAEAQEPVDVHALTEDLLAEAATLDGGTHPIESKLDAGLALLGSELELRSAFGNLISNAMRYTPAGGRIEIHWRRTPDGGAVFGVRDHGIGIAAHHLPRLTERFYRVDSGRSRANGGTGLGLAIVKHVLGRHQARLHIESSPGSGSLFEAHFPAAKVCGLQARTPVVINP